MFKFLTLLSREVKSCFCSPTAYIVICFFLLLTGFDFYMDVIRLSRGPTQVTVVEGFFDSVPFWIAFILIFPPVTMRLFAEEFKMGTIETLMTAPVTDWQVVLSKFFGSLVFFAVVWMPSRLYFIIFEHIAHSPAANSSSAYWGSYLMLLLVGMFFVSVGCFASVVTQDQIVAAVICFCIITLFFFGGLLAFLLPNVSPVLRDFVSYFSVLEHMGEFSKGIFDSRRIVFYLSATFLMLFLTHQIFQHRRWKS